MDKNIPDNKNGIPLEHYREQFASLSAEKMSERSGFEFCKSNSSFKFRFLGREVLLSYPDMVLSYASGEPIDNPATRILLARAAMEGLKKPSSGAFLAYSEVPWGNVYLQQFKGRCIMRLAFGFGSRLEEFEKACLALGGVASTGADKCFEIEFLDDLSLKLLIWAGDDEFPPSSQILFSDNFPAMFTAEDMAVVGDLLINAMKAVK